jgi:tetratricopeptide (TPR) repeat protein
MSHQTGSNRILFYVLTAIILVGGFLFWQSDLTSDPPMNFSGLGQSLYTDPAQYVFHARNYVLFGQSDPFDYPKFAVFQNSLVSRLAYVWFSIFGVSMRQANLIGVLLSLGGLIFILLGVSRTHRPWVMSAVALCYVLNVTLFVHARVPYLENGLLFSSGLLFWVYSWWGDRIWGLAVSGALVAVSMLMGKLFGALLLPALISAIALSAESRRWRRILITLGAFAITSVILAVAMYAARSGAVSGYFGEQTYGLYGFPPGLSSPWAFFEYLISYGYNNRLFYQSPDLVGFFVLGGFFLARYLAADNLAFAGLPRTTIFSLFWIVFFVGGLMPLGYSPIRYAIVLIPPTLVFCFTMFDVTRGLAANLKFTWNKPLTVILAFLAWVFLVQAIGNTVFFNEVQTKFRVIVWFTLPAAIAAALLARYALVHWKLRLDSRKLTALLIIALAVSVTVNVFRIRRYHFMERNTNILDASHDLAMILGPNAVVSGPFGPTLTLDNKVKTFIHQFGVARVDSTLFDREPVTHLAADESNAEMARQIYPQLKNIKPEAVYWICDNQVFIYDISKAFNNPTARNYVESDYERAYQFSEAKQEDSAVAANDEFLKSRPYSKAGLSLYAKLLATRGQYDKAYQTYATVVARYPTDFSLQLAAGYFTLQLATATKNQSLLPVAENYLRESTVLNPYRAYMANNIWGEFLKRQGR